MDFFEVIGQYAPTVGVIATGYFGYMASRSNSLSEKQFKEIKNELAVVQQVGTDNNREIKEIKETVSNHDESHLITMYGRLEEKINTALKKGYTCPKEFEFINKMHKNYKALGGNGYIDKLYNQYLELEIKEG